MKKWLQKSTISPHTLPEWLVNLSPGEYSIMQICKLTGQKYSNVYLRLSVLKVKTKKVPVAVYKEKFDSSTIIHGRNYVTVYEWQGYKYHLIKAAENRVAELKKGL